MLSYRRASRVLFWIGLLLIVLPPTLLALAFKYHMRLPWFRGLTDVPGAAMFALLFVFVEMLVAAGTAVVLCAGFVFHAFDRRWRRREARSPDPEARLSSCRDAVIGPYRRGSKFLLILGGGLTALWAAAYLGYAYAKSIPWVGQPLAEGMKEPAYYHEFFWWQLVVQGAGAAVVIAGALLIHIGDRKRLRAMANVSPGPPTGRSEERARQTLPEDKR